MGGSKGKDNRMRFKIFNSVACLCFILMPEFISRCVMKMYDNGERNRT